MMSGGHGTSQRIIIESPLEVVWRVLLDVDSYPQFFPNCQAVKASQSSTSTVGPVKCGTRFTKEMVRGGKKREREITVTRLDKSEGVYVTVSHLFGSMTAAKHILTRLDDSKTIFELGYGIAPSSLYGKVMLMLQGNDVKRKGLYMVMKILEAFKKRAEAICNQGGLIETPVLMADQGNSDKSKLYQPMENINRQLV